MEENRKRNPSIPSNYVTLVQLQERWIQEQQRKQIQKEEEEERNRREKKREDQENQKRQGQNGERSNRRPLQNNRRYRSDRTFRTVGTSERKSEESPIGPIVVVDEERNIEKFKQGKPGAEEDLTGGTERLLPESEEVEEMILLEDRENQKRHGENRKRSNCRTFHKNRRFRSEKSSRTVGTSERKSEESHIGAIVVADEERKNEKWKKKGKPRAEEDLTRGTERLLPENEEVEEAILVEDRENQQRHGENGERSNSRKFHNNRRYWSEKSSRTVGTSGRKSKESQIGAIVVADEERNIEKLEKKGKLRAEEDLTGGTERLSPENEEVEEMIPVEDRENQTRHGQNGERSNSRTFQNNRRYRSEKSSRTVGTSERKSEESQIGSIVVVDEKRKIRDWKNKNKKKGKPRAGEDPTGGTEQVLPENEEVEETIPVVLVGIDSENEGVRSEFQRNGKNLRVKVRVWEKKVPVDRSAEIGQKFEYLSLSGGRRGNERYARNMYGGQWRYNNGSGRLNPQRMQMLPDSNLVWVRKGDTYDVAGVSS